MIRTPAAARSAAEALLSGDFKANCSCEIAWFELGKKICHCNSAIARAMHAVFVRPVAAFMPIWGPKVTQLFGVTLALWDP